MTTPPGLPQHVADAIVAANYIEFATATKAGTPIDTPLLSFAKPDISTIGLTTGLAYPAKADRLRRNPKAGLWIDGKLPGEPTIAITGYGGVFDANVEANAVEYIAETGAYGAGASADWSLAHQSVWYWARIMMRVAPREILWWDDQDLDAEPKRWTAPADTVWPVSDPAPSGPSTPASEWRQPVWTSLADNAFARGGVGHLSVMDDEGFPRPIRALGLERTADGFAMDLPRHAPGRRDGPASLSFQGLENFVGVAVEEGGRVRLHVERALPLLPLMNNPKELWEPEPDTRAQLMGRLQAELARRGQGLPHIPAVKPSPTRGAELRRDRIARIQAIGTFASMGPGRGWSVPEEVS
jgi:hypothetical protein